MKVLFKKQLRSIKTLYKLSLTSTNPIKCWPLFTYNNKITNRPNFMLSIANTKTPKIYSHNI
jgi:hypothetical protein